MPAPTFFVRQPPAEIAIAGIRGEVFRLYGVLPERERQALDVVFADGVPQSLDEAIWMLSLVQRVADKAGIA